VLRRLGRGRRRSAVQGGADFQDGAAERGGGFGPGGFKLTLAGAGLVQLGGQIGAVRCSSTWTACSSLRAAKSRALSPPLIAVLLRAYL
jgi:hypothetical protein